MRFIFLNFNERKHQKKICGEKKKIRKNDRKAVTHHKRKVSFFFFPNGIIEWTNAIYRTLNVINSYARKVTTYLKKSLSFG